LPNPVKHAQARRISSIVRQDQLLVYGRTVLVVLLPQVALKLQIDSFVVSILRITLNVGGRTIHAMTYRHAPIIVVISMIVGVYKIIVLCQMVNVLTDLLNQPPTILIILLVKIKTSQRGSVVTPQPAQAYATHSMLKIYVDLYQTQLNAIKETLQVVNIMKMSPVVTGIQLQTRVRKLLVNHLAFLALVDLLQNSTVIDKCVKMTLLELANLLQLISLILIYVIMLIHPTN
jgi:hypothetical protein